MRFRGNRRTQRDEVQSTWNVYDAARPIRKADFAIGEPPEPERPAAAPVKLPDPDLVTQMTDAEIAAHMGISEMDVREARKWAREQDERLGTVTVTADDGLGAKH